MADENDETTESSKGTSVRATKAAAGDQPMPIEPEAPLPKSVPDSASGRQAMMASENAEAQVSNRATDESEQKQRLERAGLMAKENTGVVVDDKRWQQAL